MRYFFKKFFQLSPFFLFFCSSIFSEDRAEEEALFLRRVIEFFEEGKEEVAKEEIISYLKGDETPFFSHLRAILGDLYLREKNFIKSLENYLKVKDEKVERKIFLNFLQALYQSGQYEKVFLKVEESLDFVNSLERDRMLRVYFLLGDSYYKMAKQSKGEERISFSKKAEKAFSKFISTPLEKDILERLADISYILGDVKKAAKIYIKLSNINKKSKEEFLFKAATMQMEFDREEATKNFSKICLVGKDFVKRAAINKLILLFEANRYSDIILAKEQFAKLLDGEEKTLFKFFLGRSYFLLEDYKRASKELLIFLDLRPSDEKALGVLDMLIVSAEKLGREDLFDFALERYEKFFPEDDGLKEAYLARAIFLRERKSYKKAKKDYVYIENRWPDYENAQFDMEVASFFYEIGDYPVSRLKFLSFLKRYDDHKMREEAWRYFINSSLKMLDGLEGDKKRAAKNILIHDLESFLHVALDGEREDIIFLLAQTRYDLEDYEDSLLSLKELDFEKVRDKRGIYLLFALCNQKLNNLEVFVEFAKKALDIDKGPDEVNIRIGLFNAYLELAKEDKSYLDKASYQLYLAKELGAKISEENLLWLGDRYFKEVSEYVNRSFKNIPIKDPSMEKICDRAILVLEEIEGRAEEKLTKLADLYSYKGKIGRQKELLESLKRDFPDSEKVSFDLASIYKASGDIENAKKLFLDVTLLNKRSYYYFASLLEISRMEVKILRNLTLEDPRVVNILKRLKDIKLQKNIKNEPVHLEAAFDYVDIHTKFGAGDKKRLELLQKMREEFLSLDDIISKDYQNSKNLFPDKKRIVDAYLKLFDIKISLMKANLEKDSKYMKDAKAIYMEIIDSNLIVSPYMAEELSKVFKMGER